MRTLTYSIRHWTHEETGAGECFEVIETETRHTTTGDEVELHSLQGFSTRAEAEEMIETIHYEAANAGAIDTTSDSYDRICSDA